EPLARRYGEREMQRRVTEEPLTLSRPSLAGFVSQSGQVVNLADAYELPDGSPYAFNWRFDARTNYRTRSVLVVPLKDPSGYVLADVDHCKEINDRFGHGVGDTVLREAAQLLVNQSRSFTTVTRYGGDEFAALLVNTPKAGAVTYASRMKGVIERYPFAHGQV